jgi:hypothetical protein
VGVVAVGEVVVVVVVVTAGVVDGAGVVSPGVVPVVVGVVVVGVAGVGVVVVPVEVVGVPVGVVVVSVGVVTCVAVVSTAGLAPGSAAIAPAGTANPAPSASSDARAVAVRRGPVDPEGLESSSGGTHPSSGAWKGRPAPPGAGRAASAAREGVVGLSSVPSRLVAGASWCSSSKVISLRGGVSRLPAQDQ